MKKIENYLIFGIPIVVLIALLVYITIMAVRKAKAARFVKATEIVKGKLLPQQIYSIERLYEEYKKEGGNSDEQFAYIIATCWGESKLIPRNEIKSSVGSSNWENYQKNYWGTGYYGRGLIQITWEGNYKKFSDILGVDLVGNPEKANDKDIAPKIAVIGMMQGKFTGKKLDDYINDTKKDYLYARRIVNGFVYEQAQPVQQTTIDILNALSKF